MLKFENYYTHRLYFFKMTAQSRDDFYWEYSDEPHTTRRKQILGKRPQSLVLY